MFFPKRTFSLFSFLFSLFVVVLFAGCTDGSTNDNPVPFTGTWTSTYEDSYTMTETRLSYGYGSITDPPAYKGTIRHVEYFTNNSGVIIFEYDADGKQVYYDYDENYNITGDPHQPPGDFIATYFKNLSSTSGDFATAYDMSKPHGCETETLEAAKTQFTLDAIDTFVYQFGGYAKQ